MRRQMIAGGQHSVACHETSIKAARAVSGRRLIDLPILRARTGIGDQVRSLLIGGPTATTTPLRGRLIVSAIRSARLLHGLFGLTRIVFLHSAALPIVSAHHGPLLQFRFAHTTIPPAVITLRLALRPRLPPPTHLHQQNLVAS